MKVFKTGKNVEFYRKIPTSLNVIYLVIIYFIDHENFECVFDIFVYLIHFGVFVAINTTRELLIHFQN